MTVGDALRSLGILQSQRDVWYSADDMAWYEVPDTPWQPWHDACVSSTTMPLDGDGQRHGFRRREAGPGPRAMMDRERRT